MSDFTGKNEYQTLFNPKAYLEFYYQLGSGSMGDEYLQFALKELVETFHSGKLKGDTLIDIGTGPTIYQLLSACECFKNIIVSDFTDKNREEFNVWLKNQPGAFDWSPVVKHVCRLEGDRIPWEQKEERLRKTIKQVLKCDVFNINPIDPVTIPQVDCLLSCLCLEAACKDLESYITALKNITTLLKLGGYLVLMGVLGNNYYMVGDVKFSGLNLSETFLREVITGAGYVIKSFKQSEKTEDSLEDKADFTAHYVIVAQKERNM
ncbi:nicotinamide N-methyltransferase-like [Bufo gargarizans]|uniref:nicotinamide N-methyltransferase-like n=1 Tax=Bufo gargarizans TaxID=30331 RepID=UPI001CF401AB|nr:nicotinamide N-methyltransferase-like [Bufo gargarizans]